MIMSIFSIQREASFSAVPSQINAFDEFHNKKRHAVRRDAPINHMNDVEMAQPAPDLQGEIQEKSPIFQRDYQKGFRFFSMQGRLTSRYIRPAGATALLNKAARSTRRK